MNENIIDTAAIERLKRLGGIKFTADMIDMFNNYGAKKMVEARQAQQLGDLKTLAAAAHPLKSSAGNIGAHRVQELAGQVEQTATEQKGDEAAALLTDLEAAFAAAAKALEAEKSKLMPRPA
jgi:two-component system sensor histidine kinase/response regulator